MHIGHFASLSWEPGGVANYIRRVAEAQRQRGHHVWILDDHPPADPRLARGDEFFVTNRADLVFRAEQLELDLIHGHTTLGDEADLPLAWVRTIHGHQPYCPATTKFLERRGRPCERSFHLASCTWGHLVDHCGSARPTRISSDFRALEKDRRALEQVPLIAVSGFIGQQLLAGGFRSDRIATVLNPCPDLPSLPEQQLDPAGNFVFLGRLTKAKGILWLLDAFARVRQTAVLEVLGDGPCGAAARDLAKRLGLENRVRFHGWLEGVQLTEILARASAVIVPSLWHDPCPLSALDAAARGRAVIATRVGGLPETALPGRNAILVEPGDTRGLADAIDTLAGDPDLARRLGRGGRELALGPWRLDAHLDRLEILYRQAMADKRGRYVARPGPV